MKRAIVLVLDGCGAGATNDAEEFGDLDSPSTILHTWNAVGGIHAPVLDSLGFFRACGVESSGPFRARYGRLNPIGQGKDSVTGHWEMMGVHVTERFPTYPNGFPIPLIREFEKQIGTQTIGNRPASGTQILVDLGQLHVDTGFPIVYTSADSVFQIACHEDVVPIETLYSWCHIARELLVPPNHVQRVIARPFVGSFESGWKRTERRKDFPLPAPPNLADALGDVFGIGVVPELFGGRGFRPVKRTQNNSEHFEMLKTAFDSDARLIFANFEDFDMLFGHRNDPVGFAKCLSEFDPMVKYILEKLTPDDLLILTADHGNDPTDISTDHTREYSPVVVYGSGEGALGDREGLTCIGETVADWLQLENWPTQQSLLD